MFIAHIPVGLAAARFASRNPLTRPILYVAIIGAIFPDLDLIRFYVFDNHQRHHHDYWTHIPGVWIGIMLGFYGVMKLCKTPFGVCHIVFFTGIFSHLILDTVSGQIEWLWPVSSRGFQLVTVPATHIRWYLSFLMHWTFFVEIALSLIAIKIALMPKKT